MSYIFYQIYLSGSYFPNASCLYVFIIIVVLFFNLYRSKLLLNKKMNINIQAACYLHLFSHLFSYAIFFIPYQNPTKNVLPIVKIFEVTSAFSTILPVKFITHTCAFHSFNKRLPKQTSECIHGNQIAKFNFLT